MVVVVVQWSFWWWAQSSCYSTTITLDFKKLIFKFLGTLILFYPIEKNGKEEQVLSLLSSTSLSLSTYVHLPNP